MTFRVFFKGGFIFNVFPISAVVGDQGCSLPLGEFKREACARFQEPRVTVRDAVEMKSYKPYGAAETEAFRPAPTSLTVLVQR